ncbi:NusG domain II-containing protein [Paenibacillus cisolokensis]|uniref:NusG domain II-containing protein n=1 Tax=Paenibacillus cisolokensis TaxID=1658519 RepID=UPI003D2DAD09
MLKFKRGDVLLIALLVLLGSAWLIYHQIQGSRQSYDPATLYANINVNGALYQSVSLDGGEQTIALDTEYGHNVLKVFNHGIQMVAADCPKKISMQMGFISRPNEVIICVPNRVYVEIVHGGNRATHDSGIDAYVH